MTITVTKEALNALDLASFKGAVSWAPSAEYFDKMAGEEFYRLLSFLANAMPKGSKLVDIGTYCGLSANALSTNREITVTTYDIYDHITDNPDANTIRKVANIEYLLKDCLEDGPALALAKVVVLDVDPHDGAMEAEIFSMLRSVGFRGVVVLDDIKLNGKMKEFWEGIPERKLDVTSYGHWSGTGIVYFSDDIDIVFA